MKRSRILLALALALPFGGCQALRNHQQAGETEIELQRVLKDSLKDPESMRLKDVHFYVHNLKDEVIDYALCGEMNARNSMGGYVGYHPFIVKNEYYVKMKRWDVIGPVVLIAPDDEANLKFQEFVDSYRINCHAF